ncbi:2-amino-4-hydroxy-6-hydroxymethyldihydropteridine diphosphokinase [bacterium]|nr:2-amino-4-hydroxy-6-hydroxymethyldihydropteridine diphosphokinase [bacterium]
MSLNTAIIALGSNIRPEYYIPRALQIIKTTHRFIAESTFVRTSPLGVVDQDEFLNGAVLLKTQMSRTGLTDWLKSTEKLLDRQPASDKYGPRTIDLDLVVWNGQIEDADVYSRDFLNRAVRELDPGLFDD